MVIAIQMRGAQASAFAVWQMRSRRCQWLSMLYCKLKTKIQDGCYGFEVIVSFTFLVAEQIDVFS